MIKTSTPAREELHKHFGGIIYESDFNTYYGSKISKSGSSIAMRIEWDLRREEKIKEEKNAKQELI